MPSYTDRKCPFTADNKCLGEACQFSTFHFSGGEAKFYCGFEDVFEASRKFSHCSSDINIIKAELEMIRDNIP